MVRICSPQLGLDSSSHLGGEVHDVNFLKELANFGVKIEVLLPKGSGYEHSKNIRVEFLPISHFPAYLFNLLAIPYLFKQYKKGIRIFRFHNPYFLGIAGVFLKKRYPDSKIVTTIHLREDRWDFDLILRKSIFIYDHIFTVSRYLKDWVVKRYGVDPGKVTVIYNGVEGTLKPSRKDQGLLKKFKAKDKLVLLNVGSLSDRKNVLFLLEVFQTISRKKKDVILIICGQGPLKDELKKRINKYSLTEKVLLIDPVYGDDKNKIFNLADIFLFPSKNEGFGLVAAEAMACGKPVIASNNTSLPEIVEDGVNGYLVKTNNKKLWVDKINQLLDNPKARNFMGRNGLTKVRKDFTWKGVIKRTHPILEELK